MHPFLTSGFTWLGTFLPVLLFSQSHTLSYNGLIPDGFKILHLEEFDLDQDGDLDAVLILSHQNEAQISESSHGTETPKRLLLVARNDHGQLSTWAESSEIVYCIDCGGIMGDPFVGIELSSKKLIIYHYGGSNWRWTYDLTFTLNNSGEWILSEIAETSYHVFDMDSTRTTKIDSLESFGKILLNDFHPEMK